MTIGRFGSTPYPKTRDRPVTNHELALYVKSQQRKHREELGFLPNMAIDNYVKWGNVLAAGENGDLVSYILWYGGRPGKRQRNEPETLRLYQCCTNWDARHLKHATTLVNQLYDYAAANQFSRIRLWCAQDLDANDFWRTIGFVSPAQRLGGERRNRVHNLWLLDVQPKIITPADPDFSNINSRNHDRPVHLSKQPPEPLPRAITNRWNPITTRLVKRNRKSGR